MNWRIAAVVTMLALQAPPVIPASFIPPVVSPEDKAHILVLAQQIEIAQLKSQLAQKDFEVARDQLVALAEKMKKEGWNLDLSNPADPKYVKTPDSK
jgi:hypothetical protein